MKPRRSRSMVATMLLVLTAAAGAAQAADLVSDADLKALALLRFWHTDLPLPGGAFVARLALLDDALYVLTDTNLVYAVHSPTGIIRWSNLVAEPGQTVRGPTHARRFAFFTTPGSIRVMSRDSGEPAGEPRALHGFIIEVVHDTATITIGEAHGVRVGNVLKVFHAGTAGESQKDALAELQITSVEQRQAKGRLTKLTASKKAASGDLVTADVVLPLPEVKLPFAASSAAVGDENSVYVGAANQRFYSLDILSGFQHWQLLTPNTISATPVLSGEDLYIAGQDGRVAAVTKSDRVGLWTFQTEGPIFADPAVDASRVYVASSDRSLYGVDRKTGRRVWRERFDTPLNSAPAVAKGRVYQRVPQQGLYVLDAETGNQLWRRSAEAGFLVEVESDAYLAEDLAGVMLVRVDAATGKQRVAVDVPSATVAAASQTEQSIFLATKDGKVVCLRSEKAPRLTPAQLAEALRDEARIRLRGELEAKAKATSRPAGEVGERSRRSSLLDDDWLISRSTAKPVGGRGLVKPEAKAAGKAEKKEVGKGKPAEEEDEEGPAAKEVKKAEEKPSKDADADEEEEEDSDQAVESGKGQPEDKAGKGEEEEEEEQEEE